MSKILKSLIAILVTLTIVLAIALLRCHNTGTVGHGPLLTIPVGTIRDSVVKYRIDDNVVGTHQTYLTLTVNTRNNQNNTNPNLTLAEVQLSSVTAGSDYITFSPFTRWNGTDSLITTFKFKIIQNGVTYTKTKTERIICPDPNVFTTTNPFPINCYFGKIQGTKQFLRKLNLTTEITNGIYYPSTDPGPTTTDQDPVVVTWPPTYK